MKLLVGVIITFFLLTIACTGLKVKKDPSYKGINPEFVEIMDLYIELAAKNDVYFSKEVTIGFTDINNGKVVGLCTYGKDFREIDIDRDYWLEATKITRITLLFHEATHCYCGRDHDYGKGDKYLKGFVRYLAELINWELTRKVPKGYYSDGCPKSIMFPVVLPDGCMYKHYLDYTKEMFARCKPW